MLAGAARRGGGLAPLVHHHLLGVDGSLVTVSPAHGCLLVATITQVQITSLAILNLHLPPALTCLERMSICAEAVGCVDTRTGSIGILCGDLNVGMQRSWLGTALKPRGVWAGWRCPYRPGLATNIVLRPTGLSSTEIDWVLVGPTTPCTRASRVSLPGLSTHRAVQCDLILAIAGTGPLDPTGRRFIVSRVPTDRHAQVGAVVGIALWWGQCAAFAADALVLAAWAAMSGLVPEHRRSARDCQMAVQRAAEDLAASGGAATAACVSAWWADRSEAALVSLLHLDGRRLVGVSITSQTGRALRLTTTKVQTISTVSADGHSFPSGRSEFLEEVLLQGAELYSGRKGLCMDATRLIDGSEGGNAP